ncbi:glycosyltransferase [Candidatus Microgenomates bacterium]|nr:MAG: glycosyltransferase [Candidatus Microgenomates bacterium]
MRIAFLSFYSGEFDRGVEVATEALVQELSSQHKVKIFQAGKRITHQNNTEVIANDDWPQDSTHSWLRFFYLDTYSRKILRFTFRCLPRLVSGKFDVVLPLNGGWQTLIIRLFCLVTYKKLIAQGNAGIGRDDLWQMLMWPDYFVAISPQGFDWAKPKFPWVRKTFIPHGVYLERIAKTKPAKISLAKPIVLCVAAFSPYKHIDHLINAMQFVPEASLLVIGRGPLETKLRELGNKVLGNRFLLLTNIHHDELLPYYRVAKVFSLPSASSEAFGIVYIEALAAGANLVVPDDPGRHQLLGSAAWYTDTTNPKTYAKTIQDALRETQNSGTQNQLRQYQWENIGKQYNVLFTKL